MTRTCEHCGQFLTGHATPKLCQPCWHTARKRCQDPDCKPGARCALCVETRRRTASDSQRTAFAEYRQLLDELGATPKWDSWRRHLRDLRGLANRPYDRRLSLDDHRAYWLERFTWDEIRVIGAAIAPLLRDVEDPHCFLDARVTRTEVAA